MALQPDPFASDPYWTNEYEDQFRAAMGYPVEPQQLAADPVPEPPQSTMGPKGRNTIAMPGAPTAEEVPAAAVAENPFLPEEFKSQAPPLSPEEEAQIEIAPQQLFADGTTPYGEQGIEIDAPTPAPNPGDFGQRLFGMDTVESLADSSRKPVDPYTGVNSPDIGERSDALVQQAQTDPDAYLKQQAHEQSLVDDKRRAEEARIVREDSEREVRNTQSHVEAIQRAQQASADLETDLADLQRQKVDPDRWMNSRNSWQTVSAFVAVIAGGLAQSAGTSGGRNTGLDIINKSIDDDINAQVTNLQNGRALFDQKRGLVAEMYARTGDIHRAQETARIAMREQSIRALEVEMQQYDPKGKAARELAQVRLQAIADTQKAKQQFAKDRLDSETKEADLKNKQLDALAKQKKLQGGGDAPKRSPDYWQAYSGGKRPPHAMDQKEFNNWLATAGKVKALDKEDAQATKDAQAGEKEMRELGVTAPPKATFVDGKLVLDRNSGYLKNADGSNWKIPTDTEAKEFRAKKAAADGIVSILDEIRTIRDKVGGESSWGNSPEYGRLQVLKQNLVMLKKAGTQGMSSDADMARIEAALGADNPASFRSQAAKLDEGRVQVEKQIDTSARALHYTGDPIRYPDPLSMPKAPKAPEQAQLQNILTFYPNLEHANEIAGELDVNFDSGARNKVDVLREALAKTGGILPSIKTKIDALRETAGRDPDEKKRDFAVNALQEIANNALDETIRQYAVANAFSPGAIVGPALSPEEPR